MSLSPLTSSSGIPTAITNRQKAATDGGCLFCKLFLKMGAFALTEKMDCTIMVYRNNKEFI